MVLIDVKGYERKMYIANAIAENMERVKKSVLKQGWDYMGIVSGLPGVGKSSFAQALAKFLDPNFTSKQITFTGKEFREKTSVGNLGQAFILDESFADMNSTLYKDPEFIATINHMQLIRQRGLFLIIVLPDFFSLSKNIAIFRASHLFVPYSEDYERGDVAVFDREAKRELYIKGKPFLNYQAVEPNFRCDYQKHWFCDEQDYLTRKAEHLAEQAKVREKGVKAKNQRDMLAAILHNDKGMTILEICELVNAPERTVYEWVEKGNARLNRLKLPNAAAN